MTTEAAAGARDSVAAPVRAGGVKQAGGSSEGRQKRGRRAVLRAFLTVTRALRRPRSRAAATLASIVTLAAGIINLQSVVGPSLPERAQRIAEVLPLEVMDYFRFAALLSGLGLVVLSINIYRRKKRAFHFTLALAGLAIVSHLGKGIDYEEAAACLALCGLLWSARREFVVESSVPSVGWALTRAAFALAAAFFYGAGGFWLLEPRVFGINFHLGEAVYRTFRQLIFLGNDDLTPRTRYGNWFLDSLSVITVTAVLYGLFALFRPVYYRFRTLPAERRRAAELTRQYGRCALDYFKLWTDKTFFFSPSGRSFLAYKAMGDYAVVLGDPVGPHEEMEEIVRRFGDFCDRNDWRLIFHQTLPDLLPVYRKLGFRSLKIGDDALVRLAEFTLEGKRHKSLRTTMNQMQKQGITFRRYTPPIDETVLDQLEKVSESWLEIPGRRERTFTLGRFQRDYVRHTPVAAALDERGNVLAFVNEVPSYAKGEAALDLMRHRSDAPPGVMDYVFTLLLLTKRQEGWTRFNMGMAPMSGFQKEENPSLEERAVHSFMRRLNFLFSYQGLRSYKAKYASCWEPRYLVYHNVLTLPRIALAITKATEHRD